MEVHSYVLTYARMCENKIIFIWCMFMLCDAYFTQGYFLIRILVILKPLKSRSVHYFDKIAIFNT